MSLLFEILNMTGIIAFALSGVLVAIEYELDLFGIAVIAIMTALGGGFIRDVSLGNTPPSMFTEPKYIIVAFITQLIAVIVFKILDKKINAFNIHKIKGLISIFDAIGLAFFTCYGTKVAIDFGYGNNPVLCAIMGLLTGTGGGMLRDVFCGRKAVVLRKELYATISIFGAFAYFYLSKLINPNYAVIICSVLILAVRLIAVKKRLNIAFKAKGKEYIHSED